MSQHLCVLIVAASGPFRDGLRVLLQANAAITQVALADNLVGSWRSICQQLPDVVVVDANLLDQAAFEIQLRYLTTLTSHPHWLVIVHTQTQQQRVQSVGMPALLAGFTAEDLFALLFV